MTPEMKAQLEKVVVAVANEDSEVATVAFGQYLKAKTAEILGEAKQAKVDDADEAKEKDDDDEAKEKVDDDDDDDDDDGDTDLEKLNGSDWSNLLTKQPQFADKCPWDKFEAQDWTSLLKIQPQFFKMDFHSLKYLDISFYKIL